MTPLRQRYLEDLQLRNYSVKTQQVYVECVSLFARHFGLSPEKLGPEEIRAYQLYLIQEKQVSWSRFNQSVCALRFLYGTTLKKDWIIKHLPFPRKETRLPVILSPAQVSILLESIANPRHRMFFTTIYADFLTDCPDRRSRRGLSSMTKRQEFQAAQPSGDGPKPLSQPRLPSLRPPLVAISEGSGPYTAPRRRSLPIQSQ